MSTAVSTTPDVRTLMDRVADKQLTQGQRLQSVGDVMRACAPQMMAALPKHVTVDRMIRVAMNCIRKVPKLLECTPPSLFSAITEAATYGWELGGVLGHAYLVPYGTECQLIPGYKGLLDLCRRSGQISTVSMEVVHQGDHFSYRMGDDPYIHHTPNDEDVTRDAKPITHVYVVVVLRDGGIQRSVWSTPKIDDHKQKYSQGWRYAEKNGKKDSPWHTAWSTMAKKTVLRDMIGRGLVPLSAEYREVAERSIEDEPSPGFDFSAAFPVQDNIPTPRIEEGNDEAPDTSFENHDEPPRDNWTQFNDAMAAAKTLADWQFACDYWSTQDFGAARNTEAIAIMNAAKARIHEAKGSRKQKELPA